jgi:cytochrome oxidase assembly protein ShyY1
MITIGIAVGAGLCYWFEWYGLAFWILIYAIAYGSLSAVRAIVKPNGYIGDRPGEC